MGPIGLRAADTLAGGAVWVKGRRAARVERCWVQIRSGGMGPLLVCRDQNYITSFKKRFSRDIKHTVANGISNGNANRPFRNDFTSPVYLQCIIFWK